MPDKSIVFEAQNLKKDFILSKHDTLSAVDGVSFTIRKGECLGVIGESGCGKSTLAKIVAGVELPTAGSIMLLGEDISGLKGVQRRKVLRNMQMIFQNAINVISPRMKIGTFLLEPYINYKILPKKEALAHIKAMLAKVRLPEDILKKYPHQVSGGELQRVCIARAFALNPQLLLCDEITSALDVSVQDDVMKLFRAMQQEHGTACLFICHDLALISSYTDRVMIMYLGHAVEIMDSSELGTAARHPYTQGLLQSILTIGTNREQRIKVLEGEPTNPVNMTAGCRFCARCPRATPQCYGETPQLREVEEGHSVACFCV